FRATIPEGVGIVKVALPRRVHSVGKREEIQERVTLRADLAGGNYIARVLDLSACRSEGVWLVDRSLRRQLEVRGGTGQRKIAATLERRGHRVTIRAIGPFME